MDDGNASSVWMTSPLRRCAICLIIIALLPCAFARKAVIDAAGVKSAASYAPVIAPQMLVSIYGHDFSNLTLTSTANPFPTELNNPSVTVPASTGTAHFTGFLPGIFSPPQPYPTGQVEVIVIQEPISGLTQPFSIPGFSLGGRHTWTYTFDYRGLSN